MPIKNDIQTIPALQTMYTSDPDFNAEFGGQVAIAIMDTTPGLTLWVSFDGRNDHVKLVVGQTPGYVSSWSWQKVWFRTAGTDVPVQTVIETNAR